MLWIKELEEALKENVVDMLVQRMFPQFYPTGVKSEQSWSERFLLIVW
jgi:hypothetical protein